MPVRKNPYKDKPILTQREYRRVKEERIKIMINVFRMLAKADGFEICSRIEFKDIDTGEVFK